MLERGCEGRKSTTRGCNGPRRRAAASAADEPLGR